MLQPGSCGELWECAYDTHAAGGKALLIPLQALHGLFSTIPALLLKIQPLRWAGSTLVEKVIHALVILQAVEFRIVLSNPALTASSSTFLTPFSELFMTRQI